MDGNGEQPPFVPFTKAERIQQLGEIDRNIVSLLRSSAQAIETLGKQVARGEDVNMVDDKEQQAQIFQDSMNDFLRTLRSVNVGMKRQIWGLEEEGIITLDKETQNVSSEGGEVQATSRRTAPLKPDGDGKIGGLDVGWLNSRSDKVEKDMEADLWKEADEFLRRVLQAGGVNPTTNGAESQK
ncbi:mediator complex, subunit Med11 [Annulohypoxylon maeteangense]|uniref:mediator complex, subunit Med11 n=1 Tax=Annulohypoxylon maeteangense TaxID=1927788 RepID=UPI0020086BD7|nr:mediator complex, subunit Med11 [Annulohypoxylon maeteangense]KAI0884053.1 mediator complex, subunit Med11 [Annulohypoxylon maeteangense]